MIMIPTMIDGSLLLYAFARGRERRPARSCFRPGSDWSTPLLTPFAPATWSDRSLLILTFFLPPFLTPPLHFRFCPPLLSILSPSLSLSRVCLCLFLPSYLLLFDFPLTRCSCSPPPSSSPVLHPFFPSGSDFQARDLTAVSYLLRARILFGAPFNYLVRNSNEEEQLLY